MADIDLESLGQWVGQIHDDEDVIGVRAARLLAATFDDAVPDRFVEGMPLPALWHWLYFLEGRRAGELGRDGHPARGGFLPPVPLPNRMWAGGRISMPVPIVIGSRVRRRSSVLRVDHKRGRSGDLVFVTVLHELSAGDGELLLREEHDIVYTAASEHKPRPADALPQPTGGACFTPDAILLFRYSALTFNGHRIHYDLEYCRAVEGYPSLVVHGPLNATLLANHAEKLSGQRLGRFAYRMLAPAFVGDTLCIDAQRAGELIALRMLLPGGTACVEAEAQLAPG